MAKASKTVTRRKSSKLKKWDPRDHMPELALPFVQYRPRSRGLQCDYWKVPDGDAPDGYRFVDFLLGRHYALMAAKFLSAQKGGCSGEHVLQYIVHAMAEKRCLDLGRQDTRRLTLRVGSLGR